MQPPVRSYNSSDPSAPRKRAPRAGRRSGGPAPRPTMPTSGIPAADVASVAEGQPAEGRAGADVAEVAGGAMAAPGEVASGEEEAAGPAPVVGVVDFEEIFTRFQTPLTNFIFRLV